MADLIQDKDGNTVPEKEQKQNTIKVTQGNIGTLTIQLLVEIREQLKQISELIKVKNG